MSNRSAGWKHAKISGHVNEQVISGLLKNDEDYQKAFLKKIGKEHLKIVNVTGGGPGEEKVMGVLGDKINGKPDLKVHFDNGEIFGVSIKKSKNGQVHLSTIDRFIQGYEIQFNTKLNQNERMAMFYFFGEKDTVLDVIIEAHGANKPYERRKHRLVAETIKSYDISMYNTLLNWFKNNAENLTRFCFERGLAVDSKDYAQAVWYMNKVDVGTSLDKIYLIEDIIHKVKTKGETKYGTRSKGSTIVLPFGAVQWHSPDKKTPNIQFHHKIQSIEALFAEDN